jgi:quinol monooxygenase YgiN
MTIAVTADLKAQTGKGGELVKFIKGLLGDTRAKSGCESIDLMVNQDDSDHVCLDERWASKEDHQAYMAWRQEQGDIDTLVSFLSSPPSITYFDIADAAS